MRWLILMLVPLVACRIAEAASPKPIAYAALKHPPAPITSRASAASGLPLALPRHGVLLVNGSFFSPGADWVVVDFDARTLVVLATTMDVLPDGQRELVLTSKTTHALGAAERDTVIDAANKVWSPPQGTRYGAPIVTDVTCDIELFDGNEVLDQSGPACPYNAEGLIGVIRGLEQTR